MPSSSSMSVTNGAAINDPLTGLRTLFGHREFRQGQEEIVAAVLGGRDVLAVMPTGSGKSLGYQLPAVMLPGTTLVVSPLISLMKDQVDELNRRRIPSGALHSMLSADARHDVLSAARTGRLRLLYVAPERFASDQFLRLLAELPIARFVIDEAHCVSEWGHDFRPDYRRLRAAAALCRASDRERGRPPIAAFTATATPEVRDDIIALLGLEQPQVLVAGFDRPNIYLRVERVVDEEEKNDRLPASRARTSRARLRGDAKERRGGGGRASGLRRAGRGVSRRPERRGTDARAGRVRRRHPVGGLRDQRVRDGHRSTGRRRGRSLCDPGIAGGVLPGDRTCRPRRPCGDGDPVVGLRRCRDPRVPDRQPAARRRANTRRAIPRRSLGEGSSNTAS